MIAALLGTPVFAQEAAAPPAPAATEPTSAPTPPAPAAGIIPLPDYGGDLLQRSDLSGDCNGTRSEIAAKGLTFDFNWLQVAQTVVSGGNRIDWDYGGSLDYVFNADLQRMGVLPGGLLKVRAESRYGETVNDDTGGVLPVNTAGFFPLTDRVNEGIPFTITEFMYTQFLSPKFGVFVGKLQTLDGDPNEFAGGRGRTQFLNGNFNFNAASALIVPYSTLGGGGFWFPTEHISVNGAIMNRTDSSTTSGFDHVEDGWTASAETQFQYRLGKLPGGVNLGGAYSFADDFVQLGGKLQLIPGQGLAIPEEDDSWFAYASGWQYLYTPDEATPGAKINAGDGRPDLRGIGIFARFGYADPDTNPIDWTASIGLGGRGPIPGRDEDICGFGYVYTNLQSAAVFRVLRIEEQMQAIEAFYNLAITPAVGLTFDAQWVAGGSRNVDDATVLGVRLNIRF